MIDILHDCCLNLNLQKLPVDTVEVANKYCREREASGIYSCFCLTVIGGFVHFGDSILDTLLEHIWPELRKVVLRSETFKNFSAVPANSRTRVNQIVCSLVTKVSVMCSYVIIQYLWVLT